MTLNNNKIPAHNDLNPFFFLDEIIDICAQANSYLILLNPAYGVRYVHFQWLIDGFQVLHEKRYGFSLGYCGINLS